MLSQLYIKLGSHITLLSHAHSESKLPSPLLSSSLNVLFPTSQNSKLAGRPRPSSEQHWGDSG